MPVWEPTGGKLITKKGFLLSPSIKLWALAGDGYKNMKRHQKHKNRTTRHWEAWCWVPGRGSLPPHSFLAVFQKHRHELCSSRPAAGDSGLSTEGARRRICPSKTLQRQLLKIWWDTDQIRDIHFTAVALLLEPHKSPVHSSDKWGFSSCFWQWGKITPCRRMKWRGLQSLDASCQWEVAL